MNAKRNSLIALIVVLGLAVLGPSILLSRWFPLDIGGTFEIGHLFSDKFSWVISPYNGSGRYFPIYWIFSSLQYFAFGPHVLPYYAIQSLILVAGVWVTCDLLQKTIGWHKLLLLLATLLFFSTPMAENSSTLGKAEPLSYLLIMVAIRLFVKESLETGRLRTGSLAIISLLFALALLNKETSLVLLGFALSGLTLSFVAGRWLNRELDISVGSYFRLLIALSIGWAATKIPYVVFYDPTDLPTYLDYSVSLALVRENLDFYIKQQPDVIGFGCLATCLMFWRIVNAITYAAEREATSVLIAMLSIYAIGVAYYLALLVWRWPMPYYMLFPALIFRLISVYGLYWLAKSRGLAQVAVWLCSAVIIASLMYSAAYCYYVIGSQISYSRLYTRAIERFANDASPGNRLVLENYPFYAEQVTGTHLILKFARGESWGIGGVSDLFGSPSDNNEVRKLLGISDERMKANIQSLPKKDDYVLVITGRKIAHWFLRGVTPFIYERSAFESNDIYDLQLIDEAEVRLPAAYFNVWTLKPEFAITSLGFKLYRVTNPTARYFWRGLQPDGWIGKDATLVLGATARNPTVLKFSAPDFAMPNRLTLTRDGHPFKEIVINSTDEMSLTLEPPASGISTYELKVERTVAPKDIGLNADVRQLGLLMRVDSRKIAED